MGTLALIKIQLAELDTEHMGEGREVGRINSWYQRLDGRVPSVAVPL